MARYCIVENGIVVNVVEASAAEAENWIQSDTADQASESHEASSYDGVKFTMGVAKPVPPKSTIVLTREALSKKTNTTTVTIKNLKDLGLI